MEVEKENLIKKQQYITVLIRSFLMKSSFAFWIYLFLIISTKIKKYNLICNGRCIDIILKWYNIREYLLYVIIDLI